MRSKNLFIFVTDFTILSGSCKYFVHLPGAIVGLGVFVVVGTMGALVGVAVGGFGVEVAILVEVGIGVSVGTGVLGVLYGVLVGNGVG